MDHSGEPSPGPKPPIFAVAWFVPAIVIAVCLVNLGFAIHLATPIRGTNGR